MAISNSVRNIEIPPVSPVTLETTSQQTSASSSSSSAPTLRHRFAPASPSQVQPSPAAITVSSKVADLLGLNICDKAKMEKLREAVLTMQKNPDEAKEIKGIVLQSGDLKIAVLDLLSVAENKKAFEEISRFLRGLQVDTGKIPEIYPRFFTEDESATLAQENLKAAPKNASAEISKQWSSVRQIAWTGCTLALGLCVSMWLARWLNSPSQAMQIHLNNAVPLNTSVDFQAIQAEVYKAREHCQPLKACSGEHVLALNDLRHWLKKLAPLFSLDGMAISSNDVHAIRTEIDTYSEFTNYFIVAFAVISLATFLIPMWRKM